MAYGGISFYLSFIGAFRALSSIGQVAEGRLEHRVEIKGRDELATSAPCSRP